MQSIVIALVGLTLVAGLYQLIREQVRTVQDKRRERRISAPVHESVKRVLRPHIQ